MGRSKSHTKKRKATAAAKGGASSAPRQLNNVFEVDDGSNVAVDKRRYEGTATDVYEYEMPEDFEDEEINSDEAFNAEDRVKFAHLFGHDSKQHEDAEAVSYSLCFLMGALLTVVCGSMAMRITVTTRERALRRGRGRSWRSTCLRLSRLRRARLALVAAAAAMMDEIVTVAMTTTMMTTIARICRPRKGNCVLHSHAFHV